MPPGHTHNDADAMFGEFSRVDFVKEFWSPNGKFSSLNNDTFLELRERIEGSYDRAIIPIYENYSGYDFASLVEPYVSTKIQGFTNKYSFRFHKSSGKLS
jgi:hypothetical protein